MNAMAHIMANKLDGYDLVEENIWKDLSARFWEHWKNKPLTGTCRFNFTIAMSFRIISGSYRSWTIVFAIAKSIGFDASSSLAKSYSPKRATCLKSWEKVQYIQIRICYRMPSSEN